MGSEDSKPAVRSLGVWGSVTSLLSFFYLLVDALNAIPADLISDTKGFVIGTIASFLALLGRWKAVVKIDGFLFKK
jgi:hypothetical protein